MNEKMADSISKLIAKTNTFEKVESWLKCITLLMFIAGTASVYNSYKLYTLTKSIQSKEDKINKKLDKIIETNEKIILLHQKRNNENNTKEDYNMEIETNENGIDEYYEFVMNN